MIRFITFNMNEEDISSMKKNGNITRLRRRGLTDNLHGAFGLVDDLYMTYGGNMLTSVRDNATRLPYAGATDFDGMPGENSLTCIKGTGKLIRYQGREISQEILCHD